MNLAKIVDFERKFLRSKIWKSTEFSLNMMVISLMNCHYLRFNKTISLDLEIWIRGIEMSDSWPNEFLEIYSGNNVKFWEFDQLIDQLYFEIFSIRHISGHISRTVFIGPEDPNFDFWFWFFAEFEVIWADLQFKQRGTTSEKNGQKFFQVWNNKKRFAFRHLRRHKNQNSKSHYLDLNLEEQHNLKKYYR